MTQLFGIFVDDERDPIDVFWVSYYDNIQWKIIRTPDDFDYYINTCVIPNSLQNMVFSFDHDIQSFTDGTEVTGFNLLQKLCYQILDYDLGLPVVIAHTKNPVGKTNIESYWLNFVKFYNNRSK